MRKSIMLIFVAVLSMSLLRGQNLVINPSFEMAKDSSRVIQPGEFSISKALGWSMPSRAQATLYSSIPTLATTNRAMSKWRFSAKEGNNVVGIMTYGSIAADEKNELREYAQGSLVKPLTVGQKYYVSYWVHFHCEGTNNLGIVFTKTPLSIDSVYRLSLKPQVNHTAMIPYSNTNSWTRVRDSFIAREPYQSFIIGNFLSNKETQIQANKYKYHKAYLDDIAVEEAVDMKMPARIFDLALENDKPSINEITPNSSKEGNNSDSKVIKIDEKPASNAANIAEKPTHIPTKGNATEMAKGDIKPATSIMKGEVLILDKVLFQFNSAVLENTSATQLDKLVAFLQSNNTMKILVKGHTSSEGSDEYNQKLSENRSKAVVDYLKAKGIAQERVSFKGFGKSQPVSGNDTESSRQMNRRVEFEVIE
jgi:outer membrane protein OmpA-like peptidoglycan-associated protein